MELHFHDTYHASPRSRPKDTERGRHGGECRWCDKGDAKFIAIVSMMETNVSLWATCTSSMMRSRSAFEA